MNTDQLDQITSCCFANSSAAAAGGYSADDEPPPSFPLYVRVTVTAVCCLVMSVGVVGNLLVPLVIWRNRDLRNSTNMFLLNLSLADLCLLILCMPKVIVEVHTRPEVWVLGEIVCHMIPFMELVVAHVSVLTILSISAERYYAICVPLRVGYMWTQWRALCVIVAVWTVAIVTACPLFWIVEYVTVDYLDKSRVPVCATMANTPLSKLFFVAKDFTFFLVPVVLLLALYTVITRRLMQQPRIDKTELRVTRSYCDHHRSDPHHSPHPNHSHHTPHHHHPRPLTEHANHRSRKQVVFMLIGVIVCFFVCMLPSCCFRLFIIVAPGDTIMALGWEMYHNINFTCRIMVYINCAVNPILYNVMSSKFRQAFRRVLSDVSGSRNYSSSCGGGGGGGGGGSHWAMTTTSSRISYRTQTELVTRGSRYSREGSMTASSCQRPGSGMTYGGIGPRRTPALCSPLVTSNLIALQKTTVAQKIPQDVVCISSTPNEPAVTKIWRKSSV